MNQNENKKAGGLSALLGLNRTTRAGSFTLAMTLIVLAVLIVINLLVNALPSSITKLDTTAVNMFDISATTEKFVKGVNRNVDIIFLAENATLSPTLQTFLERYTSLNSRIHIKTADPVADPTVLDRYTDITSSGNYLIVESDLRYTIVDVSTLNYVYINDLDYSIDIATYNSIMADTTTVNYYAQYGVDLSKITYYFGGEKAVTSAIEYVVTENMPHVYLLSGNGEGALSNTMTDMFDLVMLEYENLTLEEGMSVPADASCIIINAPQHDLTTSATAALIDYVANGGNVILVTTPDNTGMTNLMSLMATVGATPTTGGMLYEGNGNRYVGTPYTLKPAINTQHMITYQVATEGYAIVMPRVHGILLDETLPDGVTATTLFSASDAYTVAADGSESDWGQVATAVAFENATTGSKVVWFASLEAFSESAAATYGMGATYYFTMATNYLNDGYASTLTAIGAQDITVAPLSVSFNGFIILAILTIVVLPIALVVSGIVVWIRRRRR